MAAITAAVVTAGVAVKSSIDAKKAQKAALKSQEEQNASNQQFIESATEQARADALPLFDEASRTRLLTGQAVTNVFSQALPAQADIFTQGNVAAQQARLAGLSQQQAAILGQPLDPSALQAQQFTPDFSFLQAGQDFFAPPPPPSAGPIPPGGAAPVGEPIFPPGTITGTPQGAVGALAGGAFRPTSQILNTTPPPPSNILPASEFRGRFGGSGIF